MSRLRRNGKLLIEQKLNQGIERSMEMNEFFETEEELQKCFLKWQPRLGLSDWNIGVALVDKTDLDGVAGESEVQWVNKCGTISILKKEYIPDDLLIKLPHEETLIHEMLHFKFFALQETSREEHFYEMMQHQLLEEIAKALFLAEYNLDADWWSKGKERALGSGYYGTLDKDTR
jgi:hypothetical protein